MNNWTQPGFLTMMWRGVRWRCPLCGGRRAWFAGWFKQDKQCHTCAFKWERGNVGFETGSMTINIIVTFGLIAASLLTVSLATAPDIPVGPLVAVLIAVGVLVPLLIFPISHTLWSAVDLTMHKLEPGEYLPPDEQI
jgi:uncharacterized protein (DUF983 family)